MLTKLIGYRRVKYDNYHSQKVMLNLQNKVYNFTCSHFKLLLLK